MNATSYAESEPALARVLGKRALVYLGILVFVFALLLIFNTGNASAAGPTYVYEDITSNTDWIEANSPYIVNASVAVDPGVTLTIEPNVTVMFDGGVELLVAGTLDAQGTADEPITFTANGSTTWGFWGGLRFNETSTGSILDNVMIHYADVAVYVEDSDVSISNTEILYTDDVAIYWVSTSDIDMQLDNVKINQGDGYGVILLANDDVLMDITDLNISELARSGIYVMAAEGIDANIDPSVIDDCGDFGMYLESYDAIELVMEDTTISNCAWGAMIYSTMEVDATLDNVTFDGNDNFGLYVVTDLGDVTLAMTDGMVNDTWGMGIYVETWDGNVTATFNQVDFGFNIVSIMATTQMNDTDLLVNECTFTGDYDTSIQVQAAGDSDFELTDNVMDGYEAYSDGWYYFDEIDYEYDIIDPDVESTSSSLSVPLPFEFPYLDATYTTVTMYRNGYINVGGNDVIPCYQSFAVDMYPNYGYKWADDNGSVTFQWDVYVSGENSYLRNVFEVIFYENGDIQFNYAEMESVVHSVYDYGLEVDGTFIDIGQIWKNSDPFDNDWTSYYFTYAPMSAGVAAYIESEGNNTAWVYDNTISNYHEGGVVCIADEGWMWMDAVNNSFNQMVGEMDTMSITDTSGALTAMSLNNTIWANAEENDLTNIVVLGVAFYSAPSAGGVDEIVVIDNTFTDVSYLPIACVNMIMDEYGTEDVDYTTTKTITDNTGENSGMIYAVTVILSDTSAWNVTSEDLITDNIFTGYPKIYMIMIPIGEGALQPMIGEGAIVSYFYVETEANATLTHTAEITDNEHVAVNLPSMAGSDGIVSVDEVIALGCVVEFTSDVYIAGNTLTAAAWAYFDAAIMADVFGYVSIGGDLTVDAALEIYNNTAECTGYGGGAGIVTQMDLEDEDFGGYAGDSPQAAGAMNATVLIWDNTILNFEVGIYFDNDVGMWDFWGDFEATIDILIMDNWIEAYDGIYGYIDAWCGFDYYFPSFEEEISSSVTADFLTTITGNDIFVDDYGIYIYSDAGSEEDYYGTFANAMCTVDNVIVIYDNTIETAYYGIYLYGDEWAYSGEAQTSTSTIIDIYGNTLTSTEGVMTAYGYAIEIDWYSYAVAGYYDFDDAPVLNTVFLVGINDNVIDGFYTGVYIYQDIDTEYGLSYVDALTEIDIVDNIVTADYGIYVDVEADDYQSSQLDQASDATADVYVEILIETNVLNPIEESMSTLGIEEGIYVYVDSDSNINDEMWVWIQSNTLNGDASSYYGIEAYGEDANVCFVITLNTVDMFEYGIYAEYGNMEITHNTVTNAWEIGVYVYDVWGVVSDNTVTDCYYGIDIDYVYDLVVSDNVITTTWEMEMSDGIYVYNADNLTIEDNIIDGYEYGMEVYYADNSLITGNTVLNSMYDAVYLYYCEYTEFTDNLVQTGYDDGVYVGSCYDFIVADNVISDFMDDGLRIYNSNRVIVADNEIFDIMDDGLDIQNSYDIELYNGLFYDCGDYAVYGSSYSMIWYIDDVAEVRNSPVYFEGDVIVQDGGWLNTDFVSSFDVVDDYYDGVPAIVVEEGGLLTATNTVFGGYWYYTNGYAWLFDVLGAMEMDNSWIYGAYQLYCGPNSNVTIHASVIAYNVLNGVYVDNCDPVLAFVEIHSNGGAGVFITGEAAEPVIKDCIITYNERGIYAYEASLGQVIDNLIAYNDMTGIYVEGVTGEIHDNILMFNQREIFVLGSEVTIEDNQIGYSVLIDIMAEYWPLIMSELSESPLSSWSFSPEDMLALMSNHIGVYVEDSVVECSGNVYGMLSYALYAVDSAVLFMDSVEMNTLVIPYFDEFYSMYNITLPIFVYDGIFASGSEIDVMSAYIEVLDDAVFLEATEAVVNSCEFDAGDFDLYAMDGSTVDVYGTELDKVKAEDTSTVDVWAVLTVYTVDPDGNAVVAYVMVFDSVHTYPMAEGNSSEDGVFAVTVMTAEWTSAGQDTSFNPYTVNAHFEGGNAVDTVTVDGPTEVTLQDPGPPTSEVDVGVAVAIAVLGGIVLIIALLTLAVRP